MIQLGAPGVYIVETSSGVRPITTVATANAVFIDYFAEGPTDRAVELFGPADFDRVYGGYDAKSESSYHIKQFFLNGGSTAYVVRVTGSGAQAASVMIESNVSATADSIQATAISEGSWGNFLRLTITNVDATNKIFNLTVARYSENDPSQLVTSEQYLSLTYGDPSDSRYFVNVVNDASQLVQLTAAGTVAPATNGTVSGSLGTPSTQITLDATPAFGVLISPLPGITTPSTPYPATKGLPTTATSLRDMRAAVEMAIRNAVPPSDPAYPAYAGATVALLDGRLVVRSNRQASTYRPDQTVVISKWPGNTAVPASTASDTLLFTSAPANVQEYVLGVTGTTATAAQKPVVNGHGDGGGTPGAAEFIAAQQHLDDIDLFNMLCIPAAAKLYDKPTPAAGAGEMTAIVSNYMTYCDQRRAMLFVDIPDSVPNTFQGIEDWVALNNNFRDKNTVIYFPRVNIPDPLAEYRNKLISTSGTLAGIWARTDGDRGVWKAPAGVDATLRGVVSLDTKVSDPQNGVLNPLAINCLRVLPIYGQVVWGARTLDGADAKGSEWKYIPIRRLALMIEESLFRGTKWVVFEPNDEPLWSKIRQNVGAFMLNLFRQGAFQGGTPSEAFYVKCDKETTTANDRNLGIVNIEVGFAPLKPAEFVVITIQQIPDINP